MTADRYSLSEGLPEELKDEALEWVLLVSSGEATNVDLEAFRTWCAQSPLHASAGNWARNLWKTMGPPANPGRLARRAVLRYGLGSLAVVAAGAAAAVHPLGELWPSAAEILADYRTRTGERRSIALAQSGAVELNTRTALNILPGRGEGQRLELVAGEAAVTAGPAPVEVAAADGRARASRSQFDIRCDGPEVRVTCLQGAIEVQQGARVVTAQPRQQVAYGRAGLGEVRPVDPSAVIGWRDGVLIFHDERLAQVIAEINRYRAARIILMSEALGEQRISVRLSLDRLDAIIPQIAKVFGARSRTLPGDFVLLG